MNVAATSHKHDEYDTFVSKALWYRTFKKLDCSLIWNLHIMSKNIHSSNCANFMKKINGRLFHFLFVLFCFVTSQNVL